MYRKPARFQLNSALSLDTALHQGVYGQGLFFLGVLQSHCIGRLAAHRRQVLGVQVVIWTGGPGAIHSPAGPLPPIIMENQMEKKRENEMETTIMGYIGVILVQSSWFSIIGYMEHWL